MSQIRLVDVTRRFSPSGYTARWTPSARGVTPGQADRAFAERAAAQAAKETNARSGQAEVLALDHVKLTIPDGQTFAVVGPSGCGKSTLLRVVAGLDVDYTGTVYYDDQDVREVPPKDRYIGMVFQNYALYPHFQGHGNLNFFFKVRRAPNAEAEERIRATSEMMGFGFEQLLDRKPGTLSGGQQQRLAIARALVRNPRLFLFDEPLSNLDARLRQQTRVEIKRLLRRFQITAIYVTHDQEEAVSLGDQIAIMREGRVEQVGPYTSLIEAPANAFVAGFLGKHPMSLVTGVVEADGALRAEGLLLRLPRALRDRFAPGVTLTIGIRPDAARLVHAIPASPEDISVRGEVEMIEPDYARQSQMVFLRAGGLAYRIQSAIEEGIRVGEQVTAVFPAGNLYVFDGKDGVGLVYPGLTQ
jgi:ABC-type sugar transport system ATPase subunit